MEIKTLNDNDYVHHTKAICAMQDVPQSTHHRVFKFEVTWGRRGGGCLLRGILVNTHNISKFICAYHTFQVHLSEAAKPV